MEVDLSLSLSCLSLSLSASLSSDLSLAGSLSPPLSRCSSLSLSRTDINDEEYALFVEHVVKEVMESYSLKNGDFPLLYPHEATIILFKFELCLLILLPMLLILCYCCF
ncbi:hypothetical protein Bca4012_097794 [Brassica carinata]